MEGIFRYLPAYIPAYRLHICELPLYRDENKLLHPIPQEYSSIYRDRNYEKTIYSKRTNDQYLTI